MYGFHGGVHPPDHKSDTAKKPIELLPAPQEVVIPLSQHIGAPAECLVRPEQKVRMGQLIADSRAETSAPVHSSVSGIVSAIEPRPHPNGTLMPSIVIKNDGEDTLDEGILPYGSYKSLKSEEIINITRKAGIVGLGGAAFPSAAKMRSCLGKADTLIINAAECEPYITSDCRLMLESPEDVVGGVKALMKVLNLPEAIVAIEANKPDCIDALRRTLPKGGDIKIKRLRTRYPQGSEKHIIRAVTGREVPPGCLPAHVGVCVFNVCTAAAVHRAITTGMPLISRAVTVSGSAVSNAKNMLIRIGSPLKYVFDATGGFRDEAEKVLMGGPMMGLAQHSLDVPVIKSTNALIALAARDELPEPPERTCIRCGKCVGVCPMRLQPIYMYMYQNKNMLDKLQDLRVSDCIECGACGFVCPGRLHLVHSFRTGKHLLRERANPLKPAEVKQ